MKVVQLKEAKQLMRRTEQTAVLFRLKLKGGTATDVTLDVGPRDKVGGLAKAASDAWRSRYPHQKMPQGCYLIMA